MKRGEIWWADLPPPRGSEPGFRRPVVIVSDDRFNDSALRTVVVVALTTNLHLGAMPGNVSLPVRGTGLSKPSVVNVTQTAAIDKADLDGRIGRVPSRAMADIDNGLRLVLGLKYPPVKMIATSRVADPFDAMAPFSSNRCHEQR